MEKLTVSLVSFFLYPGYYFGLSFLYLYGLSDKSLLYYTLPLRLFLSGLMMFYIVRNFHLIAWSKLRTLSLIAFSYIYIAKIIYSDSGGWSMSKNWYEFIAYYVVYFLIPFFFFSSISFPKHKQTILNMILFSGLLLGLVSVYVFSEVLASGSVVRVSRWTFESKESVISPLSLAYSGALTLMLCVYKLIYERHSAFVKSYIALVMVLSLLLFYLGATRGALLAILLSLSAFFYFGTMRHKMKFIVALVILAPVILYGAERTGSAVFNRAKKTVDDGHTSGRDPLWNAAFEEFYLNPVVGGRIEVSNVYPHNLILELLMGTGIVGTFIFLLFLLTNVKRGGALASEDTIYLVPLLIFICSFSQHMVSFSIYGAMMLSQPLGMFSSRVR